jgi:hypothetical protein
VANGAGFLLFPLTGPGIMVAWYVGATMLTAFTIVSRHIMTVSAQQQLTPDHLLGRVAAIMRLATWGAMPVGALFGGLAAGYLGLRPTLALNGGMIAAGSLWLLLSPLLRLRDIPTQALGTSQPATAT